MAALSMWQFSLLILTNLRGCGAVIMPHPCSGREGNPQYITARAADKSGIVLAHTVCVRTPEVTQLTKHQQTILRQLLAYMLIHPDAKDTIRGIRKWWRVEGQTELSGVGIQRVLDFLVAQEWATEREVTPAPKIYGLNKERLAEIATFLQQLQERSEKTEE